MLKESLCSVKLTQMVKKGGCAAKINATDLRFILNKVCFPSPPKELLVGAHGFDDASIIKLTDSLALVQTVDFFTPIVDSPFLFGQIAAVNALSDVYAMGGKPKSCLSVLGFPQELIAKDIVIAILAGAIDKIKQAGAYLVGGHSIDDPQLKFGLSVNGLVHPSAFWTNSHAQVGDRLILTKALGTGTLAAGLKCQSYQENDLQEMTDSMIQLNNIVDVLDSSDLHAIHAATDITGFGLAGHAMQMARESNCSFVIKNEDVPLFSLTKSSLAKQHLTRAHKTNWDYTKEHIELDLNLSDLNRYVIVDPQTSGGLLLSVDKNSAGKLIAKLKQEFPMTAVIGEVTEKKEKKIYFS